MTKMAQMTKMAEITRMTGMTYMPQMNILEWLVVVAKFIDKMDNDVGADNANDENDPMQWKTSQTVLCGRIMVSH